MDINLTLIGQLITFILFVAFTMKFVWPPILKALKTRQDRISNGLAAADQGVAELELARKKAKELIQTAKEEASVIIEKANLRAHSIEEEAHVEARNLAEQMKRSAKADIEKMEITLRDTLSEELSTLVVLGAEKLIGSADQSTQQAWDQHLLSDLSQDLSRQWSENRTLAHG